jgi:hypothetical protein
MVAAGIVQATPIVFCANRPQPRPATSSLNRQGLFYPIYKMQSDLEVVCCVRLRAYYYHPTAISLAIVPL